MDFNKYLKKNKFIISSEAIQLCQQALKIMNESKDIMHKRGHIDRILENLTSYSQKPVIKKANLEVLLLSICWHDVWKAKTGSGGLLKTIYQQIMEGVLCARLFRKAAVGKLGQKTIDQVAYAIRKHSQIQFLGFRSLEAKILHDLDKLDKWEPERINNVKSHYFATKNRFMFYLFKKYMSFDNVKDLKLDIFRKEFLERQKSYFGKVYFD